MTPPEIGAGLITQQRFVFNKLLLKQHTGFESVQAEHTLAKTVDGKNRGLVHLSFRQ